MLKYLTFIISKQFGDLDWHLKLSRTLPCRTTVPEWTRSLRELLVDAKLLRTTKQLPRFTKKKSRRLKLHDK